MPSRTGAQMQIGPQWPKWQRKTPALTNENHPVVRGHRDCLHGAAGWNIDRLIAIQHLLPRAGFWKWNADNACAIGEIEENHCVFFRPRACGRSVPVIHDDLCALKRLQIVEIRFAAPERPGRVAQMAEPPGNVEARETRRVLKVF